MRKSILGLSLAAFAVAPVVPVSAQEKPATEAAPGTHYSVSETKVGKLLDDPAAAAVLKRLIPAVYANEMFQSMGRDLTLKAIQQYEPTDLNDENLAKIQAELDKIPSK